MKLVEPRQMKSSGPVLDAALITLVFSIASAPFEVIMHTSAFLEWLNTRFVTLPHPRALSAQLDAP